MKNICFIQHETIASTQAWAKKHAASFPSDTLTCVTAQEQTEGVGQLQRPWISPKGVNIYATLCFTLDKPCPFLHLLAQLLSLSCATLLKTEGFQPEIKWPNDILLAKKKVAGILCEVLDLQEKHAVFLGIGLNINMSDADLNTIDQPATSLLQISGKKWERDPLLQALLRQFLCDLQELEEEGIASFQSRYDRFKLV